MGSKIVRTVVRRFMMFVHSKTKKLDSARRKFVAPDCWDARKPSAEDDGRRGASERAEELEEELEENPEADEEPVARTLARDVDSVTVY